MFKTISILCLVLLTSCSSSISEGNKKSSIDSTQTTLDVVSIDSIKTMAVQPKQEAEVSDTSSLSIFDERPGLWKYATRKAEVMRNYMGDSLDVISDEDFKFFLEEYSSTINRLNEILEVHEDYDVIGTLLYAEESLHDPKAVAFDLRLNDYGYTTASTEGFIFIDLNTEFLFAQFGQYLTPTMHYFLQLFANEINEPIGEDGGLIIPLKSLIDRTVRWEKFKTNNPAFVLNDYAEGKTNEYTYFILAGMDHTPAFDSDQLSSMYREAYDYAIKKYPYTQLSTTLENYLAILQDEDYLLTDRVQRILDTRNPWK